MVRIESVCLALALLALHSAAFAQDNGSAGQAMLRCDPGSRIDGIDGDGRYVVGSYGSGFNDCEIRLAPGKHVVKACYEVGTAGATDVYKCDRPRDLTFEASAGSIYRMRLKLGRADKWETSIEDVTATESNVPASPAANKSRKDIPKDQRKSMVLVRASERDEPAFLKGEVQHLWFKMRDARQVLSGPSKMHGEKDGYFTDKVANGESLAIYYMFHQEGSAFSREFSYVCATELPVYEDLPGGKVLYLGDYHFERAPGGMRFTVTHDVEAARNFLQANHPELVDKLVVADWRMLRTPELCETKGPTLRSAAPAR